MKVLALRVEGCLSCTNQAVLYSCQRDKVMTSYLEGRGGRKRNGLSEAAFIIHSLKEVTTLPPRTHKLPLQYAGRSVHSGPSLPHVSS